MRFLVAAVLAVLVVPELDAQRLPRRTGSPRPADPAALPPQAPTIAKAQAYQRLRVGVETFPVITVMHAPLSPSGTGESVWADVGAGMHVDYRFSSRALATLDVTSSAWGGLARTETIELGTRLMRDRYDSRTRPYVDLRVGYMGMYNHAAMLDARDPSSPTMDGYGHSGFAAGIGTGVYHDLTPGFSLLAATSVTRGQLSTGAIHAERHRFAATAYRVSLGLRYNPVRQMIAAQPTAP